MDVTGAVEGVVAAAVGHIDESLLDRLSILEVLGRVDEIRCTELARPLLLRVVHVHSDDLAGAVPRRSLHDRQTNAACAEDGDVGALLDTALAGRDDGRAIARCDTAAQQARPVHWCLVRDGHNGDVGDDGILREGGAAHEVQEVLALALETCRAIRHDTLALRGSNLAAEVRFARDAELALFAFWGAVVRA